MSWSDVLDIALLSPYHGGSHRSWAEGLKRFSRHGIRLYTLPARFWKWRMHGAAVTLARRLLEDAAARPDLIVATDMLDLTTFLALTRDRLGSVPVIMYLHENQLTYPLPHDPAAGPMRRQHGERDRHYGLINWASALAADRVIFNSRFHRDAFFEALPRFLRHFPEHRELATIGAIEGRSQVMPVGIDGQSLREGRPDNDRVESVGPLPPLLLWNQRWECDKDPEAFFAAVYAVADAGADFRLALCGERFRRQPAEFDKAAERLKDRIVQLGHAPPSRYVELLWEATVTVSTARHEFFGIGVLEAAFCETLLLVPQRLSYPEIVPAAASRRCLYRDDDELVERLYGALSNPAEAREFAARELAPAAARYDWPTVASRYDRTFEETAAKP